MDGKSISGNNHHDWCIHMATETGYDVSAVARFYQEIKQLYIKKKKRFPGELQNADYLAIYRTAEKSIFEFQEMRKAERAKRNRAKPVKHVEWSFDRFLWELGNLPLPLVLLIEIPLIMLLIVVVMLVDYRFVAYFVEPFFDILRRLLP